MADSTTNVTVRAPDDLIDALEREADDLGRSRAEHIRTILRERNESDARVAELEARAEELETELSRCRNARRQILAQREEHTSLVEATEQQASLAEQRADAGIATRARWWLFGRRESER